MMRKVKDFAGPTGSIRLYVDKQMPAERRYWLQTVGPYGGEVVHTFANRSDAELEARFYCNHRWNALPHFEGRPYCEVPCYHASRRNENGR